MRKYPLKAASLHNFLIKDNKYVQKPKYNLLALSPKKKEGIKNFSFAAGKHNKSRINGNDQIIPQWQRSDENDRIDASSIRYEIEKPGVHATSSSVNFKNMETRHNSWTMDTIYNPVTGGAKSLLPEPRSDKPEVKSLIKRNAIHRSYNILPSAINHTKQEYDIVFGKPVDDLRKVITKEVQ